MEVTKPINQHDDRLAQAVAEDKAKWSYAEDRSIMHGWLRSRKYHHRGKQDKTKYYTHTSWYGWNFSIPNQRHIMYEFYRAIAEDYHRRRHLDSLNQMAGTVFCAFFEFDPKEWIWSKDDVLQVGRCIQETIAMFGFRERLLYLSTKSYQGNGLHAVMPDVRVNVERMDRMRRCLLYILSEKGPKAPAGIDVSWSRIVDELVSNKKHGVHLRMNYSAKCRSCRCKEEKIPTKECPYVAEGCRNGKVFEPYFYKVTAVLNERGEMDDAELTKVETDTVYELQRTSIRPEVEELSTDFEIAAAAPNYDTSGPRKHRDPVGNDSNATVASLIHDALSCGKKGAAKSKAVRSPVYELPDHHPTYRAIQDAIRELSNIRWRQLQVIKVNFTSSDGGNLRYFVWVKGMGIHLCLNRLADAKGNVAHDNASIWFEISPAGIRQRCTGSSESQRLQRSGPCKSFRSSWELLSLPLSMKLFPADGNLRTVSAPPPASIPVATPSTSLTPSNTIAANQKSISVDAVSENTKPAVFNVGNRTQSHFIFGRLQERLRSLAGPKTGFEKPSGDPQKAMLPSFSISTQMRPGTGFIR